MNNILQPGYDPADAEGLPQTDQEALAMLTKGLNPNRLSEREMIRCVTGLYKIARFRGKTIREAYEDAVLRQGKAYGILEENREP